MPKLGRLSLALGLLSPLFPALALAQPAPAPAPAEAAPPPAPTEAAPSAPETKPETKKSHGGGPGLSLDPSAPQYGKLLVTPVEVVAPPEENTTGEWKFDVTGYFRAPLRMSWGPPTTPVPAGSPDPGTQFRTPPLVPDWNYIDWRYTNSMVGPWTELNFHYGNARVKATVQIASYNLTDAGYRRLEANLGINQSFLTINFPELFDENSRLVLTVGGFTNRYGAAGRYDGGKYETYLFGRTHVAGETASLEYDVGDWTISAEEGFGGKLEPIPFIVAPSNPMQNLAWNPYPGPVSQESTFVAHGHIGAAYKRMVLIGLHYIDTFANDSERQAAYAQAATPFGDTRRQGLGAPHIKIWGGEVKLLGGVLGDGYLGYAHLDALNAEYLGDAIETIHSFGGWQLHDNYFGPAGTYGPSSPATGKVDTIEFQHVFSFGQLFRYPQAFWGDGPDLIASLFAMYNKVSGSQLGNYNHSRLKAGADVTYLPLPWFGIGGRYDVVDPNLDDSTQNFSVFSPRIFLKSAFVTHEQILIQYSRYFYGSNAAVSQYPYNGGGSNYPHNPNAQALGADKNAMTIAAIIWF